VLWTCLLCVSRERYKSHKIEQMMSNTVQITTATMAAFVNRLPTLSKQLRSIVSRIR
jgi:hypothetical protein